MYRTYYTRWRVNAKTYPTHCRYCGGKVFYHYGSRVFFEELGQPWPKRRCREYLNRHRGNETQLN